MDIDRRTFLLAPVAVALHRQTAEQRLETFSQWFAASPADRQRALPGLIARVRAQDADIHAWLQIAPQPPTGQGPLRGIPFGVKDVIETAGLSTEYGSAIYKGRIGTRDAAIVTLLRDHGAVLFGKTHTTGFAYRQPAPTRNPRDLAHTPGGSSSGSAAAVAAGMVPVAIGTQTGGSTIRPASYCGITGFKGTFGLLSTEGVLPFARSLDTLGFFTHTAADMRVFWGAVGQSSAAAQPIAFGVADPLPDVEPPMATAVRDAVDRLRRAGLPIRSLDLANSLVTLRAAQRTIMFYEGARFHEERYQQYGARMEAMGELVREGLQIPARQYDDAMKTVAAQRDHFSELYETTPVIILPAATGPAPLGLSNTGDSSMNAPVTALGVPAITIPMPVSGLPLGLQLTADRGQDARLIEAAVRLERLLRVS
jgi:Asp-tRNA(Asn)/Glu-tRNA(Gln) amidotransferase A subunit family amidase